MSNVNCKIIGDQSCITQTVCPCFSSSSCGLWISSSCCRQGAEAPPPLCWWKPWDSPRINYWRFNYISLTCWSECRARQSETKVPHLQRSPLSFWGDWPVPRSSPGFSSSSLPASLMRSIWPVIKASISKYSYQDVLSYLRVWSSLTEVPLFWTPTYSLPPPF